MSEKKQRPLHLAKSRLGKLWRICKSGNESAESGTLSAVVHCELENFLENITTEHADAAKESAEVRSREDEAFSLLDGLARSDEVYPSEYPARLRERMCIGRTQSYEYCKRWKKAKKSG